jgi:hypothetical protein
MAIVRALSAEFTVFKKCAHTNSPHFQVPKREYVRKTSILILKEKKELKKRVDLLRLACDLRYFLGDCVLYVPSPE